MKGKNRKPILSYKEYMAVAHIHYDIRYVIREPWNKDNCYRVVYWADPSTGRRFNRECSHDHLTKKEAYECRRKWIKLNEERWNTELPWVIKNESAPIY